MIRNIFIGLVVLIAVAAGAAFLLPQEATTSRETIMAASPEQVFAIVNDMSRWNTWAPWAKMDPDMKLDFQGPASGVGAKMVWTSTKLGNGSITITESTQFSQIKQALDFDGSAATSTFAFAPGDGGTKVTWTFASDTGMNPISRYFGLLVDSMVGKDYETGLANLKVLAEADAKAANELAQQQAAADAAPVDRADRVDEVQRTFLERSLAYYRQFADRSGGDARTRLDVGEARTRVANILRKLGRVPDAEDGHALLLGDRPRQARAQMLPRVPVEVERVLHELVGQPSLAGHAPRRERVDQPVGRHGHALHVALPDEALEVQVGQAEGDAQAGGERPLGDRRLALQRFEQLEVAAGLEFHEGGGSGGSSGPPVTGSGDRKAVRSTNEQRVHFVNWADYSGFPGRCQPAPGRGQRVPRRPRRWVSIRTS